MKIPVRSCLWCKGKFQPKRKRSAQYCSHRCNRIAWNDANIEKKRAYNQKYYAQQIGGVGKSPVAKVIEAAKAGSVVKNFSQMTKAEEDAYKARNMAEQRERMGWK